MKIGGGGREQWMVLLPLGIVMTIGTIFLGGPEQAVNAMEHMAYDAWDVVSGFLRW